LAFFGTVDGDVAEPSTPQVHGLQAEPSLPGNEQDQSRTQPHSYPSLTADGQLPFLCQESFARVFCLFATFPPSSICAVSVTEQPHCSLGQPISSKPSQSVCAGTPARSVRSVCSHHRHIVLPTLLIGHPHRPSAQFPSLLAFVAACSTYTPPAQQHRHRLACSPIDCIAQIRMCQA
jgi:hypothetical protein